MDLYSILACPTCKVGVQRRDNILTCPQCLCTYPIIDGVPVLLPGGVVPSTEYQHELKIRPTYDPWVHRVVLQSLPADAIILDMGAGNLALDLPNVIRMDVTLTPYVDVVGDAHMLPFLPNTFDFVFSLAVIEHLRQPFRAAQEMYNALRNGGYVYGECNFVFAYHGYPHHYFNTSQQGLEEVFGLFEKFRSGVAPYQMPSLAVNMLLTSYLKHMSPSDNAAVAAFRLLLQEVLEQPLTAYDSSFTEEGALNVAAGVFFLGRKSLPELSEVIPTVIQTIYEQDTMLRADFPQLFNLGRVPNIMLWAKGEGRQQLTIIDEYFRNLDPFSKKGLTDTSGPPSFNSLPVISPDFMSIGNPQPEQPLPTGNAALQQRLQKVALQKEKLTADIIEQDVYIKHLSKHIEEKEVYIKRLESLLNETSLRRRAVRLTQMIRSLRHRK